MAGLGKRLRRTVTLLLATVLAVATLAGCSETKVTQARISLPVREGRVLALVDPNATHPPGTPSLAEALTAALPQAEVVPTATHDDQAARVRGAADQGVAILLVQSVDGASIGSALEAAADTGMLVVALDVIPEDLGGIDLFLGWNEFSIGEQEIAAFARAVDARPGQTKYLELFAGDEDDPRAMARFNGSMFALKAFTEAGTLSVKSGRTAFGTAATSPGDSDSVRKALDTTYQATYPRHPLHGVVIGTDELAPVVAEVAANHDQSPPLLMSSGATAEGIRLVMAGAMLTTQYRDPAALAARVAETVADLQAGRQVTVNPQAGRRNRLKRKPAILISPVLVSAENAATVLAANPTLAPLTKV